MQEDLRDDRKFALVSSGCEVIRVPRSLIKDVADEDMLKIIKKAILPYPSDKDLYIKFNVYNKWRCFREELVDNVAEFRSNIDKALKERCSAIPKVARTNISIKSSHQPTKEPWWKVTDNSIAKRSKLVIAN